MHLDKDILNRFIDGELAPAEMVQVAQQLASEPGWSAYLRSQEKLKTVLAERFRQVETTVPQRLIDAAKKAPLSPWWTAQMRLREILAMRWLIPAGSLLAASLFVLWFAAPSGLLMEDASGHMIAGARLAETLNTQLASAGNPSATTQIGISFRDRTGHDCRTFVSGSNAGLACHQDDAWQIQVHASTAREDPGAAYQMAGAAMPPAVRDRVQAIIAGSPFDAAAERAARDRHWSGQ